MSFSNRFLTGSAICLLMATPSAYAASLGDRNITRAPLPLMLAQAEAPSAECPPGTTPAGDGCVPAQEPAAPPPAPPEETAPPAEEAPAQPTPAPEEPAPEAPPPAEEAPQQQPQPPAQEAPAQPPAPEPAPEAPAVEEPAPEAPPAEEPPATEEAPAEEPPAPESEAPAEEPAPAETAPEQQPAQPEAAPSGETQEPAEQAPADQAPADQAPGIAPSEDAPPAPGTLPPAEQAPATEPGAPAEAPAEGTPSEQPVPPVEGQPAPEEGQPQEGLPENAAPVLDSQKELPPVQPGQPGQPEQQPSAQPQEQAEPVPLPQSDAEAQQEQAIQDEQFQRDMRSIVEEQGQRIELGQTPQDRAVRRAEIFERRDDANVVQQFNDNRSIVEVNNHIYVRSSDYDRLVRQDDTVYYEELRNGRVREVVERRDGSRVVTIRDRYGDVIRRVRILPDGQEYMMAYMPEDRYDSMRPFEDPGRDLPPLRLTIPADEYILDAERVDDPQVYYTFLAEPPVERVERLYSLDEVRYSARIRDKVRRIDLDTIEFEFGSASIAEGEIGNLESLASAISEMLAQNPGETFLLEGHTDAVGSDNANLALSDRRAEAVAVALTNVFDIPPETLVTQGYGEQYLKVNTQEPARENRRVAVRRITPLVTPVASQ